MLGSYGLIDFMTLLIATQLIVFAANLDNGFTILIVSESI